MGGKLPEESPGQKFAHAMGKLIPKMTYADGSEESDQEHDASVGQSINAATGMLMPEIPGVGKAVGWVADKVGSGLKSAANSLAARTLKGTAGDYRALGKEGVQKVGDFLLDKGAVKFGSSPHAVAERVATLPDTTGQALSGAIEGLDQTGAQVSKRDIADRLFALRDEAAKGGPGAASLVAKYEAAGNAILADIQTSGEPMMSFAQGEQWKRAYQAPVNYSKANNTPLEMGSKEIASAARQGVEDAASVAGEGTDLGANFLKAKEESGLAQQAQKMAKGAEGRREARNISGLPAWAPAWPARPARSRAVIRWRRSRHSRLARRCR
jgi:hypothetical protein